MQGQNNKDKKKGFAVAQLLTTSTTTVATTIITAITINQKLRLLSLCRKRKHFVFSITGVYFISKYRRKS